MKSALLFLLFLSTVAISRADNVFMNNDMVYRNVKVDTMRTPIILIDMDSRIDTVQIADIRIIEWNNFSGTAKAAYVPMTESEKRFFIRRNRPAGTLDTADSERNFDSTAAYLRALAKPAEAPKSSNLQNFFFGAICAAIAWDQFANISVLSDAIDVNEQIETILANHGSHVQIDNSHLKALKTRAYILGSAAAVAGIVFTVNAFNQVSVSATPNTLSVAYNF